MHNQSLGNEIENFRSKLEYELSKHHTDLAQKTTNLPVASTIEKLEINVTDLTDNLETDKKDIQMLRGEMINIGYIHNEENQQISQYVIDEITRLGRTFKKLQDIAIEDDKKIFEQLQKLNQERIEIFQQTQVLEHRINESEFNVGYKGVYDVLGDQQKQ